MPSPFRAIPPVALAGAAACVLAAACGRDAPPAPVSEQTPPPTVASLTARPMPPLGYTGDSLVPAPAVVARDAAGRPVPHVPVAFAVAAGGGTVTHDTVETDATGAATQTGWILGPTPGRNTLAATAGAVTLHLSVEAVTRDERWRWRRLGAPLGDSVAIPVLVDPTDAATVYAASMLGGLYASRDGGASWTRVLAARGMDAGTLRADPRDARRLWAAPLPEVYVSDDHGRTWTLRARLPMQGWEGGRSLHVSPRDGAVYVGAQANGAAPGIWRSTDGGRTFELRPLGPAAGTRILPWVIAEDSSGTLYVGCEIADHPQPYRPPFFRSTDRGATWEDVTGVLPWHVIRIGIDPRHDRILALTEGAGLYESTNHGTSWRQLGRPIGSDLLVDPRDPDRVYGGDFALRLLRGGAYASRDGGRTWDHIGFVGRQVGGLALTPASDRLYVGLPFDGIYVADVPDAAPSVRR